MIPGLAQWVRGFGASTSASTLVSARARSELLTMLGAGPEGWLADLAEQSSKDLGGREPGFMLAQSQLRPWLEWLDVRSLLALCGLHPAIRVDAEDASLATEVVHRGTSLDQVLRMLHLHQGHFTRALYDVLRVVPVEVRSETMAAVEGAIFDLWDEFGARLADGYAEALGSWKASGEAARVGYVRGLLSGSVEPADFERHTGYRLDRNHVALIAFSPTSSPKKLTAAALSTLRAVGCTTTVHALLAPNLLWAWGSVSPSVRTVSQPPPGCSGCTVAVGMPGEGLSGFQASFREAEAIQSLVSLVEWRNLGRSLAYGDIGMITEMAARPERLWRFVVSQLGSLARSGSYEADLRATVLAYLEANRSTTLAAHRLHIAKNTVSYRMKRAEEMLGRDISRSQVALQNALLTVDVLGEPPENW